MKQNNILLILGFLYLQLNAQNIKVYHGKYEANVVGTADYQYYETKDLERIYNGYFRFTGTDNHELLNFFLTEGFKESFIISGNFKNNNKNGFWDYKIIVPKGKIKFLFWESSGEGCTQHIYGNYSEGNKTGEWVYTRSYVGASGNDVRSTVHFKDNKLVGNFDFNSPELKVRGKYDLNGYMDGDWITEYKNGSSIVLKDERKYKGGVLYWQLYRNTSTGQILNKLDDKTSVLNFFNSFNEDSNSATIDGEPYMLVSDSITCAGDETEENINELNTAMCFWTSPNETNTMYELPMGSNNINTLMKRHIEIDLERKRLIDQEKLLKEQQELLNTQYSSFVSKADSFYAIKNYDQAVTEYKEALNIKDEEYLKEKIKVSEKFIEKYRNYISTGDAAFNRAEYSLAIKQYTDALKIENDPYPHRKISEAENKIEEINQHYNSNIAQADYALRNKRYEDAISYYKKSLDFKNETYPQEQIDSAKRMIVFVRERISKIYSLDDANLKLCDSLKNAIQNYVLNIFKDKMPNEYHYEGFLTVSVDTNGGVNVDLSSLADKKNKLKKEISTYLSNIHYPAQYSKGYSIKTQLKMPLKIMVMRGTVTFSVSDKKIIFVSNQPDIDVVKYLNSKYSKVTIAPKHKYKYDYVLVNDSSYIKDEK